MALLLGLRQVFVTYPRERVKPGEKEKENMLKQCSFQSTNILRNQMMMLVTFICLRPKSRTCCLFSIVSIRKLGILRWGKVVGRSKESVPGLATRKPSLSFAQWARGKWISSSKESCVEDITGGAVAFSQGRGPACCDLAGRKLRDKHSGLTLFLPMISYCCLSLDQSN